MKTDILLMYDSSSFLVYLSIVAKVIRKDKYELWPLMTTLMVMMFHKSILL